ncbi:MAG: cytochrome b, partial [Gammaproteobacteria bacterium]|nr:cytochrome b [Gammaproteobacteria bacterium]NIR94828.1 cytochrome b [Gammaproteobacteria bacterium]NIW43943.1 cytochrome b [Gammaproteobacteria bacterium]NIX55050.1 cytochrome b [candidate division Zixibacteria bacterium]
FHWLTVVLIFLLFGLGWYMVETPEGTPERSWFFALHKSVGLTLALVVLARIAWRLTHPGPQMHQSLERWQRMLATATHYCLYILML